jgi:outer membrane biosynthesis protein TonB
MNALTAVTATAYAIALWIFAPQTQWDKEVATAKRNQQTRLNPIPEPIPQPQTEPIPETKPEPSAQPETTPEPIPVTVQTPETITAIVEPIPDTKPEPVTVPTPERLNLETFTTTQLREIAKKQKLNWRPLVNGKRKPLNKPQLIQLLTA